VVEVIGHEMCICAKLHAGI